MKTSTKKSFVLLLLFVALDWEVGHTSAQVFRTLHSFTAIPHYDSPNGDGAFPYAGLILSSNTLYGTAYRGGSSGNGTVFAINTDGTGFTNLHNFTPLHNFTAATPYGTNSDGAYPFFAALILLGNTLFGTAQGGGSSGNGTVFALNTDGSGFVTLHSFTAGGTNSSG